MPGRAGRDVRGDAFALDHVRDRILVGLRAVAADLRAAVER